MSNLTINSLPTASTIDATNDLLPIYTNSLVATQAISRNTYLNLSSQPVGLTDSQTLTNKTLTSPTITSPTITNATISADTLTGYTVSNTGTIYGVPVTTGAINASYLTASSITNTQIASAGLYTTKVYNLYKFSVYRNAAQNVGNNAFAVMQCDTKVFDTGSNVDIVTNKGRFTAPIAGFYQFNASARASLAGTGQFGLAFFKNTSTQIADGTIVSSTALSATVNTTLTGNCFVQLAANDYVEVQLYGSSAFALTVSALFDNLFSGFLVSAT